MKVVLSAVNASYTHSSLAVYTLAAHISENIDVITREYNINQSIEFIVNDLYEQNADIYFFSCYIWNIEHTLKVASSLKKITNALIVFGGSEVGFNPDDYLHQYHFIDYIISGEGEAVINDFIHAIMNNDDALKLPNVYERNKKYVRPQEITFDFANRRFPYTKEIIKQLSDKIIYYESSRGCPYNCSYCISHIDKKMRYVPLDKVKEELLFFIGCDIKQVKFIDRTFNSDLKRAEDIIRFILEHNKQTNFHFEICAEILTDEIIDLLRSAPVNFFQIETGLQSTNPATLKAIGRNNNLNKFQKNLSQLIEKANIHVHADLIALLPNETYQSFQHGFNYLYEIKPHMIQLGFLKILNGTRMKNDAEKYGIIYNDYSPYEALSSDTMNHNDVIKLKKIEFLVDKYYNSGIFRHTLDYIIDKFYNNPFAFYEDFSVYFEQNGFYKRSLSRKELYQIFAAYIDLKKFINADSILLFDYLKSCDFTPPDRFKNIFQIVRKDKLSEFVRNEENIIKYLPYYKELSAKEIIKKICIIQMKFDPVLFCERDTVLLFSLQKKDNIYHNNIHYLLEDIFSPDDFS